MANFEEKDVYAALGMEMPSQQPEAADPAVAGANEQGVTDPAGAEATNPETAATDPPRSVQVEPQTGEDESANGAETAADPGGRTEGTGRDAADTREDAGDKPPMSREERAEQARLRRQREQDAAVERAVSAERARQDEQLKEIFRKAGMTDRYNGGRPITTLEEFNEWQSRSQADRLSRQLKDGSLTPETFRQAVDDSPALREAREIVDRLKAEEERRNQEQVRARFEQQVADEMAEIRKLNPSVSSLQDVLNLPTGREFARLVQERGMSYLEAFQLANMEQIMQARSAVAAEGAARQQHGKDHLRTMTGTAGAPIDVPQETVAMYRELRPEMTMDEIRRDYARRIGVT